MRLEEYIKNKRKRDQPGTIEPADLEVARLEAFGVFCSCGTIKFETTSPQRILCEKTSGEAQFILSEDQKTDWHGCSEYPVKKIGKEHEP